MKKPRKPKKLMGERTDFLYCADLETVPVYPTDHRIYFTMNGNENYMGPKEARRLAAWLLKAAAHLEQKVKP